MCRRGLMQQLIESHIEEIDELHFADRSHAHERRADRGAQNGGFGDRRVTHALGSEALQQALGHAECAAEHANILADNEHPRVFGHQLGVRRAQAFGQRMRGEVIARSDFA